MYDNIVMKNSEFVRHHLAPGESLSAFALRAGVSRATLYCFFNEKNVGIRAIQKIYGACGLKLVPVPLAAPTTPPGEETPNET